MASPELDQFEHELEAAAVQFSMAAQHLEHLSEADHAQSAEVSEARVLSAAINVLATDTDPPVEQLLIESVKHPMFLGSDYRQWRAFLSRVRDELRIARPAAQVTGPPITYGYEERPSWRPRAAGFALLVAVALGLGALLLTGGSWISGGEEPCDAVNCSGGFEAIGTDVVAPSLTTPAPQGLGTTQPGTPSSIPADAEAQDAAPAIINPDQVSPSTSPRDFTTVSTVRSTTSSQPSSTAPNSSTTSGGDRAPSTAPPATTSSTTAPTTTTTGLNA